MLFGAERNISGCLWMFGSLPGMGAGDGPAGKVVGSGSWADGKEASDDRVERSLYLLAIGWNGQPPNTTAALFWLKNRRPDRWRDVQQIQGDIGLLAVGSANDRRRMDRAAN